MPRSVEGDWYLVERLTSQIEPTSVCFVDRKGWVWEYEPATLKLHGTSWLTDALRDPESAASQGVTFKPISRAEARSLIEQGAGARRDPTLPEARKREHAALPTASRLA